VLWVNDSKATNIASTRVAVEGIARRAVVLLGGRAKGKGFGSLAPGLARHAYVLAFGEAGDAIVTELQQHGVTCEQHQTMHDAMCRAADLAQPGDAVLLSPGCSSFDAFDNFEHRGDVFRAFAATEAA
jgi:UDP-N-acetylmuramoylalanine--D-glutamate ligase